MYRVLSIIISVLLALMLTSCGKSKASAAVEKMIDSIGEVTEKSEQYIIRAEQAYDRLPEKEKEQVSNLDVLIDARNQYDDVIAEKRAESIWELEERTQQLQEEVTGKELTNAALEYESSHQTKDDAIADIARDELGLVNPGEIVFYDSAE